MTLMEAVVALLILALVSVGCLELAQGAATQEFSATQWNAAISEAESRVAEAVTAAPLTDAVGGGATETARRAATSVIRQPWSEQLDLLTVSVPVIGEKRYILQRLVPTARRVNANADVSTPFDVRADANTTTNTTTNTPANVHAHAKWSATRIASLATSATR